MLRLPVLVAAAGSDNRQAMAWSRQRAVRAGRAQRFVKGRAVWANGIVGHGVPPRIRR
ncbi:MAG TPA: hypothetical protein PKD36_14515 [Geobacter sulfurreducens]|nr:hypothetical protein [Geobacter sulfurreducens]